MSQFYARLSNGQLRFIDLSKDLVEPTRKLFVDAKTELMPEGAEEIAFDGRYIIRDDKEIAYIEMNLPNEFNDIPDNQQGLNTLDLAEDKIQSLFWYEDGEYIFQVFSSGNLLENKYVIKCLQEQHSFTRMTDKAFIINSKVQAIYKGGKLFFKSFPSASLIFDLSAFMVEATNAEVNDFGNKANVNIDVNWLTEHANNKTRRLIKMISTSGTLDTFMGMNSRKRDKISKSVNVEIIIRDGKLVLPSSVSKVNKVLEFLNEDVYKGLITETVFKTNSKRPFSD